MDKCSSAAEAYRGYSLEECDLPYTGFEFGPMVALGVVMVLLGLFVLWNLRARSG